MKKLILPIAMAGLFLTACTGKTNITFGDTDSTAAYLRKITQVAMASDSARAKKDIAGSMKGYAAGFTDYGNGTDPQRDLDSIKADMTNFFAAFPDFKGENLRALASDSTVVVLGDWSGTFKNEYMKVKATNKTYNFPDADVYTFNKAGKITSHRSVQGKATFHYQIGVPMPPNR